jgi:hypothetical protein
MAQARRTAKSTLLATCAHCGDIEVPVGRTVVGRGRARVPGWYALDCPACGHRIRVETTGHLVTVLLCLGARLDRYSDELLERRSAPALTLDDVLDLALDLQRHDDLVTEALHPTPITPS